MDKKICVLREACSHVQKKSISFMVIVGMVLAAGASQATGLPSNLTPSGAEQAGSGTGIPAWVNESPVVDGWAYGKVRGDFFKYKADKPLFVIDKSNVGQYSDLLNPGQQALFSSQSDYTMPVYQARRTCGVPALVAENTVKNLDFAKMNDTGEYLLDAYTPGVPFAQPKTAAEVIWNSKMRYRGVGFESPAGITSVSPATGGNSWIQVIVDLTYYMPWAVSSGTTFKEAGSEETNFYQVVKAPTALAGQALVSTGTAAKGSEVFYYFPGQRRTRRMPSYSYDAPAIGFENQYNVDESYMFTGQLDRFEWKLVGKKEMIVPYNAFGMYDFTKKFDDVMGSRAVVASQRRYERHRVWVVEATVKAGMRHSSPKRTFFVDEDSWSILGAVDYDAQGNVAKVREGQLIPVYETGSCDTFGFIQYNIAEGRYLMDGVSLAAGKDQKWIVEDPKNVRLRPSFYKAENLRAMSER